MLIATPREHTVLYSHPQHSPHTLKHLKTEAGTKEDGDISPQPFAAPAQLLPAQLFPVILAGRHRMPVTKQKGYKMLSPKQSLVAL